MPARQQQYEELRDRGARAPSPAGSSASLESISADGRKLAQQIEHFIDLRDEIWNTLVDQATPAPNEIDLLETANEGVSAMVGLRAGPITPVIGKDRGIIERLRCNVCDLFIARVRHEIANCVTRGTAGELILKGQQVHQSPSDDKIYCEDAETLGDRIERVFNEPIRQPASPQS